MLNRRTILKSLCLSPIASLLKADNIPPLMLSEDECQWFYKQTNNIDEYTKNDYTTWQRVQLGELSWGDIIVSKSGFHIVECDPYINNNIWTVRTSDFIGHECYKKEAEIVKKLFIINKFPKEITTKHGTIFKDGDWDILIDNEKDVQNIYFNQFWTNL